MQDTSIDYLKLARELKVNIYTSEEVCTLCRIKPTDLTKLIKSKIVSPLKKRNFGKGYSYTDSDIISILEFIYPELQDIHCKKRKELFRDMEKQPVTTDITHNDKGEGI